ncbi:class I SAM-dependent methyltransferase [Pseudomonas sp. LS1212]|uniref:class I SAM-dependent methyltransferase n=1 Tax=Pseudomonas sp. LS1212 TaxID=2972478 RepID=UPI00215BC9C8|nr:class I SAM-dependent methyltransferase [Pseudomonas sp. LS1212]UVJ46323.1 class I SAM-dependent methyltransferase [Pseudomonas sp. LS1212]
MRNESEALIASWSINAQSWAVAVREGHIRSRQAVTNSAIIKAVTSHQPTRFLDVGCSEGWLCRALVDTGAHITGFDVSPELLNLAAEQGSFDFRCVAYSDVIVSPERIGSEFDVIACNFSLLDNQVSELLAALAQVAAPKAALIIQTIHPLSVEPPYEDGWRLEHFEDLKPDTWSPMPWYFRTLGSWIKAFSPFWILETIEEPRSANEYFPASLVFTARLA